MKDDPILGHLGNSEIPAEAAAGTSHPTLLFPHESATRSTRDLSGLWKFKIDKLDEGEAAGWWEGLSDARFIPVPCSWNDLFDDTKSYFGAAWYETEFWTKADAGRRLIVRFGSAVYRAKAWLNGQLLGEHIGGHLPFAFDITDIVLAGAPTRLVVMVENKLVGDRVPGIPDPKKYRLHTIHSPQTTYDFFPYSGLHRPVLLSALPATHVHDVTVVTRRSGDDGFIDVSFTVSGSWTGLARLSVNDGKASLSADVAVRNGQGQAMVSVPAARLWSPDPSSTV